MKKRYGFDLLRDQIIDYVDGESSWMVEENREHVESEIERLFLTALVLSTRFSFHEFTNVHVGSDYGNLKNCIPQHLKPTTLIVRPQVQLEGWRVDFIISALDAKFWPGKEVWRELIVECDGHNFHERTKEQAARDRSRDRDVTLAGRELFRFTGSELWRNPLGCSTQIIDWATKSW